MRRTALYDIHIELGAKMVDFAGWSMPVTYSSIIAEHHATRTGCTLFDVSHMGRLYISGRDAEGLLDKVCTRAIASMTPEQARYTHVCREDGGILDDVIVSRLENRFLLVCNASNRDKIVAWLEQHAAGRDITLEDHTTDTVMVAIQGPQTLERVGQLLPFDISDIKRYRCRAGAYMGIEYVCSRTGYTGEDGFEMIVPAGAGRLLASRLFDADAGSPIQPAGLGARDTLRLEAGMPLYGHELSEDIDSISAGQAWCCTLDKDFIGAEVLRRFKNEGPPQTLIGLNLEGRRIARQGTPILTDGRTVGMVTSGTLSPTLERSIAMALVDSAVAKHDTFQLDLRGKLISATRTTMPFYKREA